jgi:hypothetical protein
VITCIDIATFSAGLSRCRNETGPWLPGCEPVNEKLSDQANKLSPFRPRYCALDKRPWRLDTRGVTGVSSTEFGLMQEVSKLIFISLNHQQVTFFIPFRVFFLILYLSLFLTVGVARLARKGSEILYCVHLRF